MKTVYLAGPITGLTFEGAADGWRAQVPALLPGVRCLSPLRGIETLAREYLPVKHVSGDDAKQIVTRDFNDIKTCDALLVNFLGAERVSIGTCWELGAAYTLQKPVVVVMEPAWANVHDHAFVHHTAMVVVPTLEYGCAALYNLLVV